ncbi:hypothetical protein Tco_0358378, partial [Tanacetum coccineum]
DNLQRALKNKGIVNSGCSRHMTENKAYLAEYQDYNGGPVAFGGGMTLEELSVLCTNLSNRVLALEASKDAQAAEIIKLKTRIKKLKKKSHPVISHHRAWLRSKRKLGRKESVSKQGRKNAKLGPTLDDST